jgi:hypothetical protein
MYPPNVRRAGALPEAPTEALPGSEQKIRVMIERASRREQLFHPLDGIAQRARSGLMRLEEVYEPEELFDPEPEGLACPEAEEVIGPEAGEVVGEVVGPAKESA